MKITKKQLEKLVKEAILREDDIDRAEGVYRKLVLEALQTKTGHLQVTYPDITDSSLQHYLANIIASHLFNHSKELPGQFNVKKKWRGHHDEEPDDADREPMSLKQFKNRGNED